MATVALISHDAGGAEILSSWVCRSDQTFVLVAEGPARAIFARKCPNLIPVSLAEAVLAADWLLCGSGWQSTLERDGIRAGQVAGKKTVTFLDHWVNYRQRFEEAGQLTLPDEIWVGDEEALRIAEAIFPGHLIVLERNPYILDLLEDIAAVDMRRGGEVKGTILYVCEPIADHAEQAYGDARHFGYTEQDALRYFLEKADLLDDGSRSIVIRPHPSEKADKYIEVAKGTGRAVLFGGGRTLLQETLAADIIVGCESMALVVGLLAGKRVVSSIPPGGRPCQLPHAGIERLVSLEASQHG